MDWFSEEESSAPELGQPWKVLIVDDDDEVHKVTKLAMQRFTFQRRPLKLMHAHSGQQAKALFKEHNDIALVLLDVVMESDDAGLKVVNYVRQDLNNAYTRIVLRTGQPGLAPETSVIRDYDIDGYRSKAELTHQGLNQVFYIGLRAYRDICRLNNCKHALEVLANSIPKLGSLNDIESFSQVLLNYLCSILDAYSADFIVQVPEPLSVHMHDQKRNVVFSSESGFDNDKQRSDLLKDVMAQKSNIIRDGLIGIYTRSDSGLECTIIVKTESSPDSYMIKLITFFAEHICVLIARLSNAD